MPTTAAPTPQGQTAVPSTAAPSKVPTRVPTAAPTALGTGDVLAMLFPRTSYSATSTNYAQQSTVDVFVKACGGYTARFSSCSADGGSASGGRNSFRLYNSGGTQVAGYGVSNYGNCNGNGYGFFFSYAFTGACQTYVFKQGCEWYNSCSGTAAVVMTGTCAPGHVTRIFGPVVVSCRGYSTTCRHIRQLYFVPCCGVW